jgi:hypothetical protein
MASPNVHQMKMTTLTWKEMSLLCTQYHNNLHHNNHNLHNLHNLHNHNHNSLSHHNHQFSHLHLLSYHLLSFQYQTDDNNNTNTVIKDKTTHHTPIVHTLHPNYKDLPTSGNDLRPQTDLATTCLADD